MDEYALKICVVEDMQENLSDYTWSYIMRNKTWKQYQQGHAYNAREHEISVEINVANGVLIQAASYVPNVGEHVCEVIGYEGE